MVLLVADDNDYIGDTSNFTGRNDQDQEVIYAGIAGKIQDASDTTEDGRFEMYHNLLVMRKGQKNDFRKNTT